jgi:hypothetical protein
VATETELGARLCEERRIHTVVRLVTFQTAPFRDRLMDDRHLLRVTDITMTGAA